MAAGPEDTTITVKRPLLAELHAAQAQLGAQAGKPITLTETIRILVTTWRDRNPRNATGGGS